MWSLVWSRELLLMGRLASQCRCEDNINKGKSRNMSPWCDSARPQSTLVRFALFRRRRQRRRRRRLTQVEISIEPKIAGAQQVHKSACSSLGLFGPPTIFCCVFGSGLGCINIWLILAALARASRRLLHRRQIPSHGEPEEDAKAGRGDCCCSCCGCCCWWAARFKRKW